MGIPARSEALWRATVAPARILALDKTLGRLEPGRPASFIEAAGTSRAAGESADDVIRSILPSDIDHPTPSILRVTLAGKTIFESQNAHA
jgi:imidazolonepropionase-like amidohydrolase